MSSKAVAVPGAGVCPPLSSGGVGTGSARGDYPGKGRSQGSSRAVEEG